MFEGQEGTDYTQDSVLASLFPNFLCNGGNGYSSHDISDVFEAINCYIKDREISDEKIHEILKDKSDYDLKIILEAFVNHRINILGRLNRIKYDLYDRLSRILKYGSKKEKERLGTHLSIEEYEQLKKEQIKKFASVLESKGIRATVRRTLGADINASCGQLRRDEMKKHEQNTNETKE